MELSPIVPSVLDPTIGALFVVLNFLSHILDCKTKSCDILYRIMDRYATFCLYCFCAHFVALNGHMSHML